ncbi:hypothetical protein [Actinokineospora spheciospongiae]|uniref:hypothetical protein n=1 Tax=Actinokineospora spheciospongiae TaxID=909613 RepID=UPI0011B450FB|nr:hypothetical protein [Actinokineospora spheciospongiae]
MTQPLPEVPADPRLLERAARLLQVLAAGADGPPATVALQVAVALRGHVPDTVIAEADAELIRLAEQWCLPTTPDT